MAYSCASNTGGNTFLESMYFDALTSSFPIVMLIKKKMMYIKYTRFKIPDINYCQAILSLHILIPYSYSDYSLMDRYPIACLYCTKYKFHYTSTINWQKESKNQVFKHLQRATNQEFRLYHITRIFGSHFNLVNCEMITKLNVHHLAYHHGFLSIEYSKSHQ